MVSTTATDTKLVALAFNSACQLWEGLICLTQLKQAFCVRGTNPGSLLFPYTSTTWILGWISPRGKGRPNTYKSTIIYWKKWPKNRERNKNYFYIFYFHYHPWFLCHSLAYSIFHPRTSSASLIYGLGKNCHWFQSSLQSSHKHFIRILTSPPFLGQTSSHLFHITWADKVGELLLWLRYSLCPPMLHRSKSNHCS